MNYLFSMAILLFMLAPQDPHLPNEFYQLNEEVRDKATIVVSGTYGEGRGPCIFMPDGTRRWPLESRFSVAKVYRGKVGGKTIYLNRPGLPKTNDGTSQFQEGQRYLVLLRPKAKSMKAIKAGDYLPAWDALSGDEIVAVVPLR